MDRLSKRLLSYLNSADQPSAKYHDFVSDIDKIANALETDTETLRAAVRYLESDGYLKYLCNNTGDYVMAFYLDHKGLHWKEFRREEILRYLSDKWIDCFSLLVSFLALVISGIALWPKGSG